QGNDDAQQRAEDRRLKASEAWRKPLPAKIAAWPRMTGCSCVAPFVLLGFVACPCTRTKSITVPRSAQPFQHRLRNSRTVARVVLNTLFERVSDLLLQRLDFPCQRAEYGLGTFARARFIPGDCRHGSTPVLSVVVGLVESVLR